jgi:glycosyltransferase involved in cell wall biosynthesis
MARYLGITDQTLVADIPINGGLPESTLTMIYNIFDVYLSTTQGEGFGLPCFEAMACGVPPIVPDWAAFGELVGDAGIRVPCSSTIATEHGINVIGGVMDKRLAVEALELMYADRAARERYSARSVALAGQSRYRWENIGEAVRVAVNETLRVREAACA